MLEIVVDVLGRLDDRFHVLGEAGAAVADAREQEMFSDANWSEADALDGPELMFAPVPRADVSDLVHERDARREHRVGGVLGKLRRLGIHVQDRVAGADERARRARS